MESIPESVKDLLADSPLRHAQLVGAWEGLSVETQITLLTVHHHLTPEVLAKALDSPNVYVRYRAALSYPLRFDVSPWLWRVYLTSPEAVEAEVERQAGARVRALGAFAALPPITPDELAVGDYVIHADHGVGVYRGTRHMKVTESEGDYLYLEYRGGDRLYVPLDRIDLIRRYTGSENVDPLPNYLATSGG